MSRFIMIGADVEHFVLGDNNEVSHAIGRGLGSKNTPLQVKFGNLQEDNVAAEYAIDPCRTEEEWIRHLRWVRVQLKKHLKDHNLMVMHDKSYHHFTKEVLLAMPVAAMEMGCMPDYNVYLRQDNPRPSAYTSLRTAAGHVHFSYENPHQETTERIIKCMDYLLGVWSVMLDDDRFRRQLYGRAGCCRIKSYGGEYRTLGNFWTSLPVRQAYVFRATKACVEHHEHLLDRFNTVASEERIQTIINDYDTEEAGLLMRHITDTTLPYANLYAPVKEDVYETA